MRRLTVVFLAGFSRLLSAATTAIWLRSYSKRDVLTLTLECGLMWSPSWSLARSDGIVDEIITQRLRLRRATPADLDAMYRVMSDATAMRYWSTPPHADPEQTRAWLGRMIAAPADGSDDFIVEHAGRVIGKAGCWRLPEVGFILHPDHWGKGLASEAMAAVVRRVFARFPVADVDPRNAGSLKLLARLCFREVRRATRTWRVGTEWCDSVYLALPRPS